MRIIFNKIYCKKRKTSNSPSLFGSPFVFLIEIELLGACELDSIILNVVLNEGFVPCSRSWTSCGVARAFELHSPNCQWSQTMAGTNFNSIFFSQFSSSY